MTSSLSDNKTPAYQAADHGVSHKVHHGQVESICPSHSPGINKGLVGHSLEAMYLSMEMPEQ